MVRVPVQVLPQVNEQVGQPTQLQAQRAVPFQNFGAVQAQQLGGAIQDLGVVAIRLGEKAQDEFDAAELKGADNMAAQSAVDILQDPTNGYFNKTGKDATGDNRTKAFDELRKRGDAIEKGLRTDTQKQLFREEWNRRMTGWTSQANTHEAREIRAQSLGESRTSGMLSINEGMKAFAAGDMETFRDEHARVKAHANDQADLLFGTGPSKQRDALVLEETTKLHTSVVQSMLQAGQGAAARDYLSTHSAEIDAGTMLDLQRDTATSVQQGEAERIARQLILSVDDAIYERINRETDWNAVRKGEAEPSSQQQARPAELMSDASRLLDQLQDEGKLPAGVRADVLRLVKQESEIREQATAENTVQTRNLAQDWLAAPENRFKGVRDLPPPLLRRARDYGLLDDLNTFSDTKRTDTDPQTWVGVLEAHERGQLSRYSEAQLDVMFGGKLSPQKRDAMFAMRAKELGAANKAGSQLISDTERVRNKAIEMEILPRGRDATKIEAERFAGFEKAVQDAITALRREASPKELDEIMNSVALDQAYADYAFGDKLMPVSTLTRTEQESAYVLVDGTEVKLAASPPDVDNAITESLRRRGKPVTAENIMRDWIRLGRPKSVAEMENPR